MWGKDALSGFPVAKTRVSNVFCRYYEDPDKRRAARKPVLVNNSAIQPTNQAPSAQKTSQEHFNGLSNKQHTGFIKIRYNQDYIFEYL